MAMSCGRINTIRQASDAAGLSGTSAGYWTVTPADNAYSIFGRHDCTMELGRNEVNLDTSTCQYWNVDAGSSWTEGAYWHANSQAYYWFMGQGVGTVKNGAGCANTGAGLSFHTGGAQAPFHRGWCESTEWGLVYVR